MERKTHNTQSIFGNSTCSIRHKKSFEKWRPLLFGTTGNFNDQILPYGILLLTFIKTNVFYLLSFKFSG